MEVVVQVVGEEVEVVVAAAAAEGEVQSTALLVPTLLPTHRPPSCPRASASTWSGSTALTADCYPASSSMYSWASAAGLIDRCNPSHRTV